MQSSFRVAISGFYFKNTMIMWVMGFIPQILVSLLLAAWFSNPSLRLKGQRFFKTVIYLPNLIMASAFAMLFFTLFADGGPINAMLMQSGILKQAYSFFSHAWSARTLVAVLNFLMWFGNTTILLMAGMMGIDSSLYEAAEVDGATSSQIFRKITLPLLRPILIYVMITSLIGGMQMFDVPQILTTEPATHAFHYDTDHVPEQASVQQELRNGWCIIRIPVHYHRSAQPDRIPL